MVVVFYLLNNKCCKKLFFNHLFPVLQTCKLTNATTKLSWVQSLHLSLFTIWFPSLSKLQPYLQQFKIKLSTDKHENLFLKRIFLWKKKNIWNCQRKRIENVVQERSIWERNIEARKSDHDYRGSGDSNPAPLTAPHHNTFVRLLPCARFSLASFMISAATENITSSCISRCSMTTGMAFWILCFSKCSNPFS